jgi:L-asparaginase
MHLYETGCQLLEAGIISGHDSTVEAALTKLMFLIGKGLTPDAIRAEMKRSLAGEITI